MNKQNFQTVEDLLSEESFRQWVLQGHNDHASFWESWSMQDPKRKIMADKASHIIKGLPFDFKEQTVDINTVNTEWQKLQKRIESKPATPSATVPSKHHVSIKRRFIRAAAAIFILATVGAAMQNYVLNPLISHQTQYGEQVNVVLPDNTQVSLNANSVLTYRKQQPRHVWLDGEAFFNVQKKPSSGANFLVMTNDLTIEVLGTAFNVNEKATKTEVILEEGSIKLNLKRDFEQELYMDPGELVTYSIQKTKEVEKRKIIAEPLTSWKNGVLEFEDVPLQKVMDRIVEVYGWKPVYQNEALMNRRISMGLPSNDLESVLTILSKAINIKITKVDENKILQLE